MGVPPNTIANPKAVDRLERFAMDAGAFQVWESLRTISYLAQDISIGATK